MFKPTFSLLLFLWGTSAGAASLTRWQQLQALSALEDYCGSAWCEGDFSYKFEFLRCNAGSHSCRIGFTLAKRGGKRRVHGTCAYSPVSSFRALMSDEGGAEALNDSFIEALDDCFEKAESQYLEKTTR